MIIAIYNHLINKNNGPKIKNNFTVKIIIRIVYYTKIKLMTI